MGDYESYSGEKYPDEEYPVEAPRPRRHIDLYWVREIMRTLMFAGAAATVFCVLAILLSLLVHGNIKW